METQKLYCDICNTIFEVQVDSDLPCKHYSQLTREQKAREVLEKALKKLILLEYAGRLKEKVCPPDLDHIIAQEALTKSDEILKGE